MLKKELKTLSRIHKPSIDALRREGKARTDAYDDLVGEYLAMCGPFEEELLEIESHDLRLRALKWAVDVPPFHEWEHGSYGHYYLDEATRARIRLNIRKQKRESTQWWVDVFGRMAPYVLGILGALIGVLNACQNN